MLHEDHYTFLIISHSLLFRVRNVSDISCRENQNVHFMCSNSPQPEMCHLWDNVELYCSARQATDGTVAHMHCMLDTKGCKHTLILCDTAFPLQHWLHECASLLLYTYIAFLANCLIWKWIAYRAYFLKLALWDKFVEL